MIQKTFQFQGIGWQIAAEDENLVAKLSRDFESYRVSYEVPLRFRIQIQDKIEGTSTNYFLLPGKSYRFSLGLRKRFFEFDQNLFGSETFVNIRQLTIFGSNQARLREVVLSYVNSVLGELMDLKGWHRLHACGVEIQKGHALAIPLNSEGGKSSFTYWASESTTTSILSDETLFTNGSEVIGFYTRLSLRFRPQKDFEIYHRLGQKEKYLTDIPSDRLLQEKCRLSLWLPKNKWTKSNFLFAFVFGLGSAQMIEFFVRPNNIFGLIWIFFNRVKTGFQILGRVSMRESWSRESSENFGHILHRFRPT